MKTLRSVFGKDASGITCISLVLVMFLAVSCEKEEITPPIADESSDVLLKGAAKMDGTYELEGTTHFPAYAVEEHRVISPWELNFLTCEATLTVEGHEMTLEIKEYFGDMLMRMVTFSGKISSGGVMKFSWPDTWWEIDGEKSIDDLDDQILAHTGCVIYGPGNDHGTFRLDYKGKFDGEHFYTSAHFMGKQVQFGVVPFYSEALLGELIEGPIQFEFTIELDVVGS